MAMQGAPGTGSSKSAMWVTARTCVAVLCALWVVLGSTVAAQSQDGTFTTYHDYDPPSHNWALDGLYCATVDLGQPLSWRKEFYWTAFCGSAGGPMRLGLCGRCLRVTNDDTGDSVKVRIMDECANGGLDLEQDAFNAIDTDGQGYFNGHLFTRYSFVDC